MRQQRIKVSQSEENWTQIASGSFIGLCVIALVQLLSVAQLDISLSISLYCFAAAVPLLTLSWIIAHLTSQYEYYDETLYKVLSFYLGIFLAFYGVCSLFWHFSWTMGALFLILSLAGLVAAWAYFYMLENLNDQKTPDA